MYTSSDYIAAAAPRKAFIRDQLAAFKAQAKSFEADIDRLGALLERTREEMASYLLADVDDEALTSLETKLRYPGLLKIKRGFEAKLARAEKDRARYEATPEIEHYDFHVSRINDDLADLTDPRQAFNAQLEIWHDNSWFQELDGRGFFALNYDASFFDHFWDWRAVSLLMEDLEDSLEVEYPDSEAVREAYRTLRSEADPVLEAWDDLRKRLEELRALKARYDKTVSAPERLFGEMYESLTEAILDHLDSCDDALRIAIADSDPFMVTFLKKESGLAHQVSYLKQLVITRIETHVQALEAERTKIDRKLSKYRRKRKTVDAATIVGLRNHKEFKWNKRHAKIDKLRDRITNFKRYDQGTFTEDYLWWDAMTRAAPADDIYEVSTFRRAHPEWDWRSHHDRWAETDVNGGAMDTAAEALAERMRPADDDDWASDAS